MLKLKDIIAMGLLAVVSFPVVLLGVLLWTGNVRMVFGPESQDPNARARLLERPEDIPGATTTAHSTDSGTGGKGSAEAASPEHAAELDQREAEVLRETKRLEELRADDAALRDTIRAERERLEKILSTGDSLESRRTEVLAATFVGMKPDQAAKIMSALDDILVTAVLRKVADDKPRAKMLAALGKIDVQRAARVARLLDSGRGMQNRAASDAPATEPAAQKPAEAQPANPTPPEKK